MIATWVWGIVEPGWYMARWIWDEEYSKDLRAMGYIVRSASEKPKDIPE